jgi:hypothetical protein
MQERIDQCAQYARMNQKWICLGAGLCALLGFALYVILSQHYDTSPCVAYGQKTLAKDVSLTCLQTLWTSTCSGTFPPAGYQGFWNQSPQGLAMVACPNRLVTPACGIGSYNNIISYLGTCRPEFTG